MLWEVFRQLKNGKIATDGSHWSEVLAGVDCIAKPVRPENIQPEYLNSGIWYWQHTGNEGVPPVFQLVWPGNLDGPFPWDEGCEQVVRDLQPPLYLPKSSLH
jgi:hypothetical protein